MKRLRDCFEGLGERERRLVLIFVAAATAVMPFLTPSALAHDFEGNSLSLPQFTRALAE